MVGHRIVHGGPDHDRPALVDDGLLTELRALVPLAPLHLPAQIATLETTAQRVPGVPQVACFDTAFHRRMPEVAQRLPLPTSLWDRGVRRYGFHGLSYEYVSATVDAPSRGRVVLAHLGSGASMVALRDGTPIDTTMGLTPAGGLVMGTRTGDIDPGVVLYLIEHEGYDAEALAHLVNDRAGLLAISERTGDLRELLAAAETDPRAALALAAYVRSLRQHLGALAAELGGLDLLVFTGGVGEHAPTVRADACATLGHLGIELDPARNASGAGVISAAGSACEVRVVATDEELVIARHARACVGRAREV
ncbi:MAG TPA: acetate/propionate family kinase [Acidimicrobiales bacterium]